MDAALPCKQHLPANGTDFVKFRVMDGRTVARRVRGRHGQRESDGSIFCAMHNVRKGRIVEGHQGGLPAAAAGR